MYYGRIPPHIALGDSVTISKEAQRLQADSEPEAIDVEFRTQDSLERPFILFLLVSGSFVFGTVVGTLWSWYG